MKIMLNGSYWLGPRTCKLVMHITHDTGSAITPRVAGPWGMFRRMRLLCGGQIVEDIDQCGCLPELFHMMKPSEKRAHDSIEGFWHS